MSQKQHHRPKQTPGLISGREPMSANLAHLFSYSAEHPPQLPWIQVGVSY